MEQEPAFERVGNDRFLWKHLWLLDGHQVRCRYCEVEQPLEHSHLPFCHEADCPARTPSDQYPWRDLIDVLTLPYRH
ncbi:hypothetical protein [Pseudomonas sp. NPDC007930]|uniref:hypothetical protein n=1 Tax=Pseudomonas sp. NPDC007930 TaxID=3364417 RepID=UPI0036EE1739